jgi:hypothetical protein
VKALSGIPFSISTHGQDFMSDLGSDELLREICRRAEFVANETEFSKGLVASRCPESVGKMLRVFNGMELANFPSPARSGESEAAHCERRRLIEFKGYHHLIAACAELRQRGWSLPATSLAKDLGALGCRRRSTRQVCSSTCGCSARGRRRRSSAIWRVRYFHPRLHDG